MSFGAFLSFIQDKRVDCWSALIEFQVDEYLSLVENAYHSRGGIRFQREPLRTTSARRIRSRLVDDLKRGAVIPPLVIGIVIADEEWEQLAQISKVEDIKKLIRDKANSLSIIDGMQRTTALMEARDQSGAVGKNRVRVEAWLAKSTESLIYRMLVLNTGQVPWNIKQQLSVVFDPLVKSIEEKVKFERLLDSRERRTKGGEFRKESLIESYIAFGLRKTDVDTPEALANEFSRLDIAEALSTKKYEKYFYHVLQCLVDLDIEFSRYGDEGVENREKTADSSEGERDIPIQESRLNKGRNIFDSQAARVGFIVASANVILGRIGNDKEESDSLRACENLVEQCSRLITKLQGKSLTDLGEFLRLDVLGEMRAARPSSAVGRWERMFFETAFRALIDQRFDVKTLETCWRA
jgi:hypothetical protein